MKKRVISKEYLLEVAHTIALQEGPESLSIRNVAKHAKISVGSVYNYFESKEDLTHSLIDNIWDIFYNQISTTSTHMTSYVGFLEEAYDSMYQLTKKMYSIFDFHIKNSNEVERSRAMVVHTSHVKKLKDLFMDMMLKDGDIRSDIWDDSFNKETFSLFVVKNYFSAIKSREQDISFLIQLIKKTIY